MNKTAFGGGSQRAWAAWALCASNRVGNPKY